MKNQETKTAAQLAVDLKIRELRNALVDLYNEEQSLVNHSFTSNTDELLSVEIKCYVKTHEQKAQEHAAWKAKKAANSHNE